MGYHLGAERMTCPLLVTTVKLGPEPQWIMEAAQSQEQAENAKKWWGLWPWGELGARSHVRRLSLCRPRDGGQKSAEQSGSTLAPEAPAPSRLGLEALHIAPVSGPVRGWGPWTSWVTGVRVQGRRRFLWARLRQPLHRHFRKYHTWNITGLFISGNEARFCVIFLNTPHRSLALCWWSRSLFKHRESFSRYSTGSPPPTDF